MENLEKLGLHDLRNYAREIGVRAPTSYVKVDLIEEIKRVEKGEVKPHYSNRGRPYYEDMVTAAGTRTKEKEQELNAKIKELKKITNEFLLKLKALK